MNMKLVFGKPLLFYVVIVVVEVEVMVLAATMEVVVVVVTVVEASYDVVMVGSGGDYDDKD